jgi:hypothetical protein
MKNKTVFNLTCAEYDISPTRIRQGGVIEATMLKCNSTEMPKSLFVKNFFHQNNFYLVFMFLCYLYVKNAFMNLVFQQTFVKD